MPKTRTERRGRIRYPEDWEIVESGGVGPFETRVVYRLPDGSHYVWESRRHRKGRGPRNPSGQAAREAAYAPEVFKDRPWLGVWAPHRLSWWVAVVFVVGSALFTLGALASLFPQLFGVGQGAALLIDLSYWSGALLFTISIYLWLLEGINDSDYITAGSESGSSQRFEWFAWQPRRLAFMAPFLFLIGSLLWNLETTLALGETLGWIGEVHRLLALSSIFGSILFLVPSYLQLIEVCHTLLCWQPREISWWLVVFFIVGSAGFVVGAVVGFGLIGLTSISAPLIVKLGYLLGSLFFLIGSYLMLPELASE